jgi:hypothetical protein
MTNHLPPVNDNLEAKALIAFIVLILIGALFGSLFG